MLVIAGSLLSPMDMLSFCRTMIPQILSAHKKSASSYGAFSKAVAAYHDSTLDWFRQSWVWMAAIKSVVPQ